MAKRNDDDRPLSEINEDDEFNPTEGMDDAERVQYYAREYQRKYWGATDGEIERMSFYALEKAGLKSKKDRPKAKPLSEMGDEEASEKYGSGEITHAEYMRTNRGKSFGKW